jgi:hypothetical protein
MTTTADLMRAGPLAAPRGARVAAELFARLAGWLTSAPAPRAETRVEQAAAVRELAYSLQDSDPGFASDLLAAALRHEAEA